MKLINTLILSGMFLILTACNYDYSNFTSFQNDLKEKTGVLVTFGYEPSEENFYCAEEQIKAFVKDYNQLKRRDKRRFLKTLKKSGLKTVEFAEDEVTGTIKGNLTKLHYAGDYYGDSKVILDETDRTGHSGISSAALSNGDHLEFKIKKQQRDVKISTYTTSNHTAYTLIKTMEDLEEALRDYPMSIRRFVNTKDKCSRFMDLSSVVELLKQ